jgi:hypothetical protein
MTNQNQKFLTFALSFCIFIFTVCILRGGLEWRRGLFWAYNTNYN